jgi:hypothetical protein
MNELSVRIEKPLTALAIQSQVNTIQEVMNQVMKQNVHYGIIPGCKEPSLFKPGAEKIMATFRLSADPEVIDISDADQIRYRVKLRLISSGGVFVGAGIGECSSNEEKYKWRKAICKEEFDEAPVDRKREKWSKGFQNKPNYKQQQIRTEPADLANTILKMAKKRALIDAVLTCTAASDCFTQDIEDLPEEYINQDQPRQQDQVTFVGENHIKNLRDALSFAKYTEENFCRAAGIKAIDQLALKRFAEALNHIKSKAHESH